MAQTLVNASSQYRSIGWTAIASGIIGILSIVSLIGYLVYRDQNNDLGILMNRFHDVGVMFQFLLMIPITFGFYMLSQKTYPAMSRLALHIGVWSLLLTSLFLALIFSELTSDILYMFPQGIFGVWLIFTNIRLKEILPKGLIWFGIIVGFGLTLVGLFLVGFVIFVSTTPLWIPMASQEVQAEISVTDVNIFLHNYALNIGSLLGVLTLPFWTIFIGAKFIRMKVDKA